MTRTQPSFQGLIGVSRCDITPPVGIHARHWGAAAHDVAEGIHRPITLTCLTFQAKRDEQPLVLIGADLCSWRTRESEWAVRGAVLEALSLDQTRLMFCVSHTHSAPGVNPEDATKPGGQHIGPYLERVRAAAVHTAKQALTSAVPATLAWRYGTCDLATNRDLRDPNRDRYIVGFNPSQSADDTLLVGRVTNEQGRVFATLVNYACHPTTLAWDNRLISPDYVGAMRDLVETQTHAPCLFLQGASGELAPAEQYSGDTALADAHGRRLGYAVLATLEGMLPPSTRLTFSGAVESGAALAVWKREHSEASPTLAVEKVEFELPLKPMQTAAQLEKSWRDTENRVEKERLWRKLTMRRWLGDGTRTKCGLWCWRLGDSLVFGQAQEAYSAFQMRLRQCFPNTSVAVIGMVNGGLGYLPPHSLYGLELYQVWQTPFGPGSLELLTEEAVQAGERLQPIASTVTRSPM